MTRDLDIPDDGKPTGSKILTKPDYHSAPVTEVTARVDLKARGMTEAAGRNP
jgi:hypothetical protein